MNKSHLALTELLKVLRKLAKDNSLVFKETNEKYNNKTTYSFYSKAIVSTRTSNTQTLKAWRDDYMNNSIEINQI
tara:strand:+ start:630 stop:854 length:225 start_codon:yes stop_codon:yes gene_type:complete